MSIQRIKLKKENRKKFEPDDGTLRATPSLKTDKKRHSLDSAKAIFKEEKENVWVPNPARDNFNKRHSLKSSSKTINKTKIYTLPFKDTCSKKSVINDVYYDENIGFSSPKSDSSLAQSSYLIDSETNDSLFPDEKNNFIYYPSQSKRIVSPPPPPPNANIKYPTIVKRSTIKKQSPLSKKAQKEVSNILNDDNAYENDTFHYINEFEKPKKHKSKHKTKVSRHLSKSAAKNYDDDNVNQIHVVNNFAKGSFDDFTKHSTKVVENPILVHLNDECQTSVLFLPEQESPKPTLQNTKNVSSKNTSKASKINKNHMMIRGMEILDEVENDSKDVRRKSSKRASKVGRSNQKVGIDIDSLYDPINNEQNIPDIDNLADYEKDEFYEETGPTKLEPTVPPTQESVRKKSIARKYSLTNEVTDIDKYMNLQDFDDGRKGNKNQSCFIGIPDRSSNNTGMGNEQEKEKILKFRIENTDLADIFRALDQSDQQSLDYMLAYTYVLKNFIDLDTRVELYAIKELTFLTLIGDKGTKVYDEKRFYDTLWKWLNHDSARKKLTAEVMSHVRFNSIPKDYLIGKCFEDLKDQEICKEWIRKAYWYRDYTEKGKEDISLKNYFPPERCVSGMNSSYINSNNLDTSIGSIPNLRFKSMIQDNLLPTVLQPTNLNMFPLSPLASYPADKNTFFNCQNPMAGRIINTSPVYSQLLPALNQSGRILISTPQTIPTAFNNCNLTKYPATMINTSPNIFSSNPLPNAWNSFKI
ncbi:unnamed protein product [Gordionus sp. m RMFG-2023]